MYGKIDMDLLMYSMLVSMNKSLKEHEITPEDAEHFADQNVTVHQTKLYLKVIEMLNNGISYDEILKYINELDLTTYKNLNNEQKNYMKRKLIKDVNTRRVNEMKNNKGDVKYE